MDNTVVAGNIMVGCVATPVKKKKKKEGKYVYRIVSPKKNTQMRSKSQKRYKQLVNACKPYEEKRILKC